MQDLRAKIKGYPFKKTKKKVKLEWKLFSFQIEFTKMEMIRGKGSEEFLEMLHIQVGETVKHKRSFLEQSKLCNGVKSTRLAPNQGIEEKKRAESRYLQN